MKLYSVMDLGRDSPVLFLDCHQSFCSRSIWATDVSNFSRTAGELLPLQNFRTLFVKLSGSRCESIFSRRLQQVILSVSPPTALVSAPTSNPIVSGLFPLLPNTFVAEMSPSMPPLDPQARLRLWSSSRTRSCSR